jgi:hypothetical protein
LDCLPSEAFIIYCAITSLCFAGSHLTIKSWNTGETTSKPLSKSRCILMLLAAVNFTAPGSPQSCGLLRLHFRGWKDVVVVNSCDKLTLTR